MTLLEKKVLKTNDGKILKVGFKMFYKLLLCSKLSLWYNEFNNEVNGYVVHFEGEFVKIGKGNLGEAIIVPTLNKDKGTYVDSMTVSKEVMDLFK